MNYPSKEIEMSPRSFLVMPVAVVGVLLATAAVAQQPAQAAGQAQLDPYEKAFSACMEGKGYTAK